MAFRLPPPLPVAKHVQITYQKSVKFKKISDQFELSELAPVPQPPQPQPRASPKPLQKLKKSQKSASRIPRTSRSFTVLKDPVEMPLCGDVVVEVEPDAADALRNTKRKPLLKAALKSQSHSVAIAGTKGTTGTARMARTRPSAKPTAGMSTSRPLSSKPVNQRIPYFPPGSLRSISTSTSRLPKNLSKHMDHYHQIYNINSQKQAATFLWHDDEIEEEECNHQSSIKAPSSSVKDAYNANDTNDAIRDQPQPLLHLDHLHQTYTSPPTPPLPPPLKPNPSSHLDHPQTSILNETNPDLPSIPTDIQGRWSRPSLTRILNPLPQITGKQGPLTSSPDPIALYKPDKKALRHHALIPKVRSLFSVETPKTSDPILVATGEDGVRGRRYLNGHDSSSSGENTGSSSFS